MNNPQISLPIAHISICHHYRQYGSVPSGEKLCTRQTPSDLILVRYLQTICLHPISSIVHKPSKQAFTSDALLRMAWQQLAIEHKGPIGWPSLFVSPSLVEAISQQLTRHLYHHKCRYAKQGRHPIPKCLRPLCAGFPETQFKLIFKELQDEPRLYFDGT